MLEADPNLLLDAGHVKTPGGDEIRDVTIYELVLGAGDYELAKMVESYFSKIKEGEKQRLHQYERYQPHIEAMLQQKPYDLAPLIELIKKSSAADVTALLNRDMTHKSEVCDAIIQFRKDWAPRILTTPCMHYNYASLQHAYEQLYSEWDNLFKTGGDDYDKILLVWRQVIGFEMRRLPGIDRCVMAQGLDYVIEKQEKVTRSYKFKEGDGDFPITATDDSFSGLGSDFSVAFGQVCRGPAWESGFGKLMSNKSVQLTELMQSQPACQMTGCLIL